MGHMKNLIIVLLSVLMTGTVSAQGMTISNEPIPWQEVYGFQHALQRMQSNLDDYWNDINPGLLICLASAIVILLLLIIMFSLRKKA